MAQLTLELEPGLLDRYGSLRECLTSAIYARGLKRVAGDLDKAPGNLSRELAGDSDRHFSIEALERYIQTQGDMTPIYYLIARYLGDRAAGEAAAVHRIESMMQEMAGMMAKLGGHPVVKAPRR